MDSEQLHNKLVNASRVEGCTFTEKDYNGSLDPNEVFAIGLAVTDGTHAGLKDWLLDDEKVLGVMGAKLQTINKIHVKTQRATYVFEYNPDDYSMNIGVDVVCQITALEFYIEDDDLIPDSVLEHASDTLADLTPSNRQSL